jgi:uncharacterized OB-fold protein
VATRAPSTRGGRAARTALTAAAWLLFGAAATVGVAWGGAWWLARARESAPVPARWPPEVSAPAGWPPPAAARLGESAAADILELRAGWPHDEAAGYTLFAAVGRCGWPARALHTWTRVRADIQGGRAAVDEAESAVWTIRQTPQVRYVLPVLPLWPGFAVDTLLYAAAGFGAARGARSLRHRTRARRGRCPGCGDDRAGLAKDAACPECGAGGGSMKRPVPALAALLAWLLAWLLAGAAVTVGVAWGAEVARAWPRPVPPPASPAAPFAIWWQRVWPGVDEEPPGRWPLPVPAGWPPAPERRTARSGPGWAEWQDFALVERDAGAGTTPAPIDLPGEGFRLHARASGWPALALASVVSSVRPGRGPARSAGPSWVLRGAALPAWLPGLPLRPLWRGFALDAALCAAALWGSARGLRLARARRLHGRCPRCGYPRAALPPSAPCPECGPDAAR